MALICFRYFQWSSYKKNTLHCFRNINISLRNEGAENIISDSDNTSIEVNPFMAGDDDDDNSENENDKKRVGSQKMGVIEKSFSSSTCDIKASKHWVRYHSTLLGKQNWSGQP